MELGLSLGDSSSKPEHHNHHRPRTASTKKDGLNFCMALGILSDVEEPGNSRKPKQNDSDDHIPNDGDDQTASEEEQEEGHCRALVPRASLQLDLLPLVPVPRHHPFPWSSDNGSSENGSSGNMELLTTARGFDVSRLPKTAATATEEVSSSFCMESSIFKRGRSGMLSICEAAGNDAGEAERASSRASDEDENNGVTNARKKLRLSKQQSAFLEESFKENHTLNPKQKLALAKQLNLRPRQVEVWFQNRRARTKLKQTEIDCDYLKRCCETLTEENKRLHKELQELRALKTSNPFYSNLPATTLTMCPSCERVATTTTTATVTTAIATISDSHPTAMATVASTTSPESIPKAIPFLTRAGSFPFTTSHNHAAS